MRILAIETSGPRGGIALAEDFTDRPGEPTIIVETLLAEGLRHGRDLILVARDACRKAGWDPRSLPAVAISIGPGSFTGIRIAVTLAKFMAWDTGAKVVAVPSFRALAANAPADRPQVVAVFDAKRGGLFASIFERAVDAPTQACRAEVFGPALIEPDELARRLQSSAYIIGHGIQKSRAAFAAFDLAPEDLWDSRPAAVARLGLELAACGEFADPLRLEPLYLRVPEAEELWEKRHKSS